jgi:hypothetical protein
MSASEGASRLGLARWQAAPWAGFGKEGIRFDAVKVKRLVDAHPAFSDLQQTRDASPIWARYVLQKSSRIAAVSQFR